MNQSQEKLNILFYDENSEVLKKALDYFSSNSYFIKVASIKSEAMQTIIMGEPEVIIMESLGSEQENEFFKALRKIGVESQIIIYTDNISKDIKYKKQLGLVYEVVNKSQSFDFLLDVFKKAQSSFYKIHEINSKLNKENDGYKRELDWLIWQHKKENNSKHILGKTIMETLTHSIFQGMGMGAALSVIDLMNYSKKEEEGFVKIKASLFQSLMKNSIPMKLIKEKLDGMIKKIEEVYDSEKLDSFQFNTILKESVHELEIFKNFKKNIVVYDEVKFEGHIISNSLFLKMVFKELLTNAFKYSQDNSKIFIAKGFSEKGVSLLFINSISQVTKGIKGIPPEFENEIFEPFFRINRIYDERFYLEELGFGLGLSVVQKGMHDLGGKIFVYEGIDHVTSPEPEKKIFVELIFNK